MINKVVVSALVLGMFAASPAVGNQAVTSRDRREFANAISTLKEGAAESEVVALLGPPEDVRTQNDPGGITTIGTKEVWRYGTSGHLTVATLGQVYFDTKGRVQYVFGKGTPPAASMFEEGELRHLLGVLADVPSYGAGLHYNPRKVIKAVNVLQPLGKERALAAVGEFLRVSYWHDNGRDGVFLVLRTLFDVPDDPGFMPPMPGYPPRPDQKLLPRFPIAIEGDIPLLVGTGSAFGGLPEQPESHLKYFRAHGKLRDRPLSPTTTPFKALEEFARSPRWPFAGGHIGNDDWRGRQLVSTQLLRLIDTVYRVEPGQWGELVPSDKRQAAEIIAGAASLKIAWDAAANQYTLPDGTTLPPSKPYRHETWRPEVPDLTIEVDVKREGPRDVTVSFAEDYEVGKAGPMAIVRILRATAPEQALLSFRTSDRRTGVEAEGQTGTKRTRTVTKSLKLEEGSEIRIELKTASQSITSQIIRP